MDILIIIISAISVLFLPGLALSYAFFSNKQIDILERIALSFALSIAIVPLVSFYFNLIGVPIRKETVAMEIAIIIIIAFIAAKIRQEREEE